MQPATAVILALPVGDDDRRGSSPASGPKALVPVATRPILFHVLDALRDAGVVDAVLLASAGSHDAFKGAVGDGARWSMRVVHRTAAPGAGLGEALRAAAGPRGAGALVVHQADALLRPRLGDHLEGFAADGLDALALTVAGDRGRSPSVVAGYVLNARAVGVLRDGSGRDPLDRLRDHGRRVRSLDVAGCMACHGGEAKLLEANRYALSGLRTEVGDAILEGCELQGDVVVHPTATLQGTLVRGPAIIGPGSQLADSYVGPYTSIGADVRVQGTEIEHSIVMDGARLMFVGTRIETSIIGRGAKVARRYDMPSAVRMSIGDGADVALS